MSTTLISDSATLQQLIATPQTNRQNISSQSSVPSSSLNQNMKDTYENTAEKPKTSLTAKIIGTLIGVAVIGGGLAATRKWTGLKDIPLNGWDKAEKGIWAKTKYSIAKAGDWICNIFAKKA